MYYKLLAVVAAVGLASLSACGSANESPPAAANSAPADSVMDSTPQAWGTMATLVDGAQLTVSQPVRKGSAVSYEVTVTNLTTGVLSRVQTANITADGLPVYFGNSDTDAGQRLTVMKDQTVKYTVKRTGIPATAKTLTMDLLPVFNGGSTAIDQPMWTGDIA